MEHPKELRPVVLVADEHKGAFFRKRSGIGMVGSAIAAAFAGVSLGYFGEAAGGFNLDLRPVNPRLQAFLVRRVRNFFARRPRPWRPHSYSQRTPHAVRYRYRRGQEPLTINARTRMAVS